METSKSYTDRSLSSKIKDLKIGETQTSDKYIGSDYIRNYEAFSKI